MSSTYRPTLPKAQADNMTPLQVENTASFQAYDQILSAAGNNDFAAFLRQEHRGTQRGAPPPAALGGIFAADIADRPFQDAEEITPARLRATAVWILTTLIHRFIIGDNCLEGKIDADLGRMPTTPENYMTCVKSLEECINLLRVAKTVCRDVLLDDGIGPIRRLVHKPFALEAVKLMDKKRAANRAKAAGMEKAKPARLPDSVSNACPASSDITGNLFDPSATNQPNSANLLTGTAPTNHFGTPGGSNYEDNTVAAPYMSTLSGYHSHAQSTVMNTRPTNTRPAAGNNQSFGNMSYFPARTNQSFVGIRSQFGEDQAHDPNPGYTGYDTRSQVYYGANEPPSQAPWHDTSLQQPTVYGSRPQQFPGTPDKGAMHYQSDNSDPHQ